MEELCWWDVIRGGGCVSVLIFDRWEELGRDVVCTGVFLITALVGSVGVDDDDDDDSGGSPVGTKV